MFGIVKKIFKTKNTRSINMPNKKIYLKDNMPLSDDEFDKISDICDIFTAIVKSVGSDVVSPPSGGVFWDKAMPNMGPFELYSRKNRNEINHLFLLFNAFRDFCALAYEDDFITKAPDYWVRRYARLTSIQENRWHAALPARFGEIGWSFDGKPVNRWTSVNQERINLISMMGITDYLLKQTTPRILEIGAGAGELAYTFSKALPEASWYDVDLLGCLIYAIIQLSINIPEKQHKIYVGNIALPDHLNQKYIIRSAREAACIKGANVYIPHFLAEDFRSDLNVHFAYNTYSFGEMPVEAVKKYSDLLSFWLAEGGILYEQNGYFPERGGDNIEPILSDKFKKVKLPSNLDGRCLPNGPVNFWDNNEIGKTIYSKVSNEWVKKVISSFDDGDDKCDIKFPNEQMWPKVYELISVEQNVNLLYPW